MGDLLPLTRHPEKNSFQIAVDGSHAILHVSEDVVRLNFPDGRPLIEAHVDGKIRIRGEDAPVRNQAIYEGFQLWLEQSLTHLLHLREHQVALSRDQRTAMLRNELMGQQKLAVVCDHCEGLGCDQCSGVGKVPM